MAHALNEAHYDINAHLTRLELTLVICEDIKLIIEIPFKTNLIAVNAMLITRRAGIKSRGFGIIALELRLLSGRLRELMDQVSKVITLMIYDVVILCKTRRMMGYLQRAQAGGDQYAILDTAIMRKQAAMDRLDQGVEEDLFLLLTTLEDAYTLCKSSEALSRNAKIEAAYGQELSGELKLVADRIETTMDEITASLQSLIHNIRVST
ncbi:MAG: methyl-accepting chemotaxis protein [Methylobacter sp.]|nr:methyl-accepting chemotaxis protein [Methylobacter sp.]MDP2429543.1 methyl-accepting chemotaxis protein [Methylobacter sp.]MDP3054632.1 methyl-accepting chemotaxis protein [Methylobacter sp.]MDP3363409.1 methyl-accepting chemotaxis protein [Methylobacter sp.]MDZ4220555.1 methyl-accepting chemotaxis protein [Methylobacter sp.]